MPENKDKTFVFWHELKRRKVFRVVAMYAATAFIILEAGDIVLPRLGLPDWTVTFLIVVLIAGLPIVIILSWIFDITPQGIIKTKQEQSVIKKDQTQQRVRRIINANNIVIFILFSVVCILIYPKVINQDIDVKETSSINESIDLIAVLPFLNTKSDPETDYLGFALADQIIGNLIYLKNLSVRPSSSIRKFDKQSIDPISAGKELDVKYILTGNFLKEANIIRLNIELVNIINQEMIWHEPIEVDYTNAFELQDIVTKRVVEGLNLQFSENELNRISKDIPVDPMAYEYYLRSISYPFTNEGDQLAIQMLNKSIELDSNFALAYAQLADRVHRYGQYGLLNPDETKRSENLYLKALSINDEIIYGISNLAQIYTETDRIDKAVRLVKQILEINPNYSEAHFSLGYIYRYAGMNTEAVLEMERAVSLDSKNPGFRSIIITYEYAGDLEKSLEVSKIFEQSAFHIGQQAVIFLMQGKSELALDYFKSAIEIEPNGLQALWAIGLKSYLDGNINAGLEAGRKFEEANIVDPEAWYQFAGIYSLLGDREGCARLLKRAVEGGFFNYPHMIWNPFFDTVRDDREFLEILEVAKKKHNAFKERYFGTK